MTDQDRIVQAARQNGWHLRAGTDGRTFHFAKGQAGITVRFSADGSLIQAMTGGLRIRNRKLAIVLEALRKGTA